MSRPAGMNSIPLSSDSAANLDLFPAVDWAVAALPLTRHGRNFNARNGDRELSPKISIVTSGSKRDVTRGSELEPTRLFSSGNGPERPVLQKPVELLTGGGLLTAGTDYSDPFTRRVPVGRVPPSHGPTQPA